MLDVYPEWVALLVEILVLVMLKRVGLPKRPRTRIMYAHTGKWQT